MGKKLSTKEFKIKANKIHNNFYDYSLVDYKNAKTKIKIICPIHGVFEQTPDNQLSGKGCSKCNGGVKNTEQEFKIKANKIHNNFYDYFLVNYKNAKTKIKIICPIHGVFEQTPDNHINKRYGCPSCSMKFKNKDLFIKISNKVHNNIYDYSLVDYKNGTTKVKIICKKHGIFKQRPEKHLIGQGCPSCNNSHGENIISNYLKENNINFIKEFKFKNCKDKKHLPFDFYLPDYNLCIEYDGIQHFKKIDFFGGKEYFNKIKKHDQLKNNFCEKNQINILRIKYINKKDINNILKKELNKYENIKKL